jgi:hypothetical protein
VSARGWLAAWAAVLAASWLLAAALPARADRRQSARTVRYDLDARLDPVAHVVHGSGTIAWRSDAKVPVPNLRFHLYLNAFRDEKSTFLRGRPPGARGSGWSAKHPGSIEVTSLRLRGGEDLTPRIAFVSPDDANPHDRTVADVPLPRPVEPGEEVVLEVEFVSRLPKVAARTGFGGDFHMVAQWFPKLGVWEDEGEGGCAVAGWNCHQFHPHSEFFSDFGVYDVRIRVPAALEGKVGATGEQEVEPVRHDDGTVTLAFHAEDVHDFAWVVGERLRVFTDRFEGGFGLDPDGREAARVARALGDGRRANDLALPPVDVTFLLAPEHVDQLDRHRRAVFHALTYMGLWFGPYPYPTLTVVDPDARGARAGGMEYPTLITGGTGFHVAERGIDPEFVLVHEFGHQHFYGLLASNEFEDAWLDEGLNTYATAKTLERAYGPRAMATIRWWSGLPFPNEPPFEFPGVLAGMRRMVPFLADEWLPFGRLGVVRAAGASLGGEPPAWIAPWPADDVLDPVAFLRDLPTLTHPEWPNRTVGEHERIRFARAPDTDSLVGRSAWQYLDGPAYGNHTYRRTANLLRTLEGLLGEDAMIRLLRTYAERFRFAHPTPGDFFQVAREVAGFDLAWFFDEYARRSPVLDFGVDEIEVLEPDERGEVESTVRVRRFGSGRFPTILHVFFEDGTRRKLRWELDDRVTAQDGLPAVERAAAPPMPVPEGAFGAEWISQYRWVKLRFRGPKGVAAATVDGERLVGLEHDRSNDGRRVEKDGRASNRLALRVLGWVEQVTTFYGGL